MQYGNQGDAAVVATPQYRGIFRNWKKWIASAAVLAVAFVGAVVMTDAVNTSSDGPKVTVDGALLEEATPIQIAKPGITTNYYGNSGELFPEGVSEDPLARSLTERQMDAGYRSAATAGAGAVTDPQFSGDAITRMYPELLRGAEVTAAATDPEFNADAATRIHRDRLPGAAEPSDPPTDALTRHLANRN